MQQKSNTMNALTQHNFSKVPDNMTFYSAKSRDEMDNEQTFKPQDFICSSDKPINQVLASENLSKTVFKKQVSFALCGEKRLFARTKLLKPRQQRSSLKPHRAARSSYLPN